MSVAVAHEINSSEREASVLVLGNSLGTTAAMWEPVVPALAAHRCLVRYDHRGQGASPAPPGPYAIADLGRDVVALLDRLEIDRAAYCGVSLGAMVGLWLAAHAPDRIEALVVCSGSAHLGNPAAWVERAEAVRAAGSTAPIADAVVGRWLTPGFAARRPDVADRLRAMVLASPPAGYAGCCGALERLDLRAELARITAPTLVIAGAQDTSIPPDHGRAIAAAVPGARFELLSPAAHIPMAECPGTVAALILRHLGAT
ncbi:MAG TPA: 3-oxoadipate enol-lactonase [Solirubrobacteraceae bacterium]|nr:3-oxoadipate enol-lactonase [Solirubrobacteraceae bacterium]